MPEGYHYLIRDQRCQLHILKNSGESISNIAIQLGVDRSPLYRELNGNRGLQGVCINRLRRSLLIGNGMLPITSAR